MCLLPPSSTSLACSLAVLSSLVQSSRLSFPPSVALTIDFEACLLYTPPPIRFSHRSLRYLAAFLRSPRRRVVNRIAELVCPPYDLRLISPHCHNRGESAEYLRFRKPDTRFGNVRDQRDASRRPNTCCVKCSSCFVVPPIFRVSRDHNSSVMASRTTKGRDARVRSIS